MTSELMLQDIITAFWFFLPAGLANMFPVFASRIPIIKHWDYPMDFNLEFRGKRLLGPHKTMRGLVTGAIVGILTVWLQKELYLNYDIFHQSTIDYTNISPLYLGGLLGFGAIFGDAVKSFFKRQMNIPSGESWLFFDQVDYIIGGIVFSYWYVPLSAAQYVNVFLIYFVLHFITNGVGYLLGVREKPI
jgi:CDP-2,3-bis-(O-geranylgeranyl)-sn-glycerol synthase